MTLHDERDKNDENNNNVVSWGRNYSEKSKRLFNDTTLTPCNTIIDRKEKDGGCKLILPQYREITRIQRITRNRLKKQIN